MTKPTSLAKRAEDFMSDALDHDMTEADLAEIAIKHFGTTDPAEQATIEDAASRVMQSYAMGALRSADEFAKPTGGDK